MKTKEPKVAAALNIIPGLGYLYINQKRVFGWMMLCQAPPKLNTHPKYAS